MCAFARRLDEAALLVVVPRLAAHLKRVDTIFPLGSESWGDTEIVLPSGLPHEWRDVLTGRTLHARGDAIGAADAFAALPVAVLVATPGGPA